MSEKSTPSQAPETPSAAEVQQDTASKLTAVAESLNKDLFENISTAFKGLSDPEMRSASISYLLALFGKLSQGQYSELDKVEFNPGAKAEEDKKGDDGKKGEETETTENAEEDEEDTETDKALDEAEVRLEEEGRSGKGTDRLPYRFLTAAPGVANGGCLGYLDGKGEFDPELAKSQIRSLAKNGVKNIFSLYGGSKIKPIVAQLANEGLDIAQFNAHLNTDSATLTEHNIRIFERLAKLENVYIHCRHGAHRAIIATAGAMLKKGAPSLEAAFTQAGGKLSNFIGRDYAVPMLSQLIEYSQKLGKPVEEEFLSAIEKGDTEEAI